jgi:hypothetical protein
MPGNTDSNKTKPQRLMWHTPLGQQPPNPTWGMKKLTVYLVDVVSAIHCSRNNTSELKHNLETLAKPKFK